MNPSEIPDTGLRARGRRDSIAVAKIRDVRAAERAAEADRVATKNAAIQLEETVDAHAVGTHIAESRTAGLIADDAFRTPGAKLPTGWSRVPTTIGNDLKAAGAEYLQSPTGAKFIAFSKAAAQDDVKGRLADSIGMATNTAVAANSIGKRLYDVPDVTYTGAGRGGALAKLAAESASFGKDADGTVMPTQPKLCVPINAQSISPRVYASFGLNPKTHSRETLNVEYTNDAKDRLVTKLGSRRDPSSVSKNARQAQQVMRESGNGSRFLARLGAAPAKHSASEVSKARETLRNKDMRVGGDTTLAVSSSLIAQDQRIGRQAATASPTFTAAVVLQRLGTATAGMRVAHNRSYDHAFSKSDRGR